MHFCKKNFTTKRKFSDKLKFCLSPFPRVSSPTTTPLLKLPPYVWQQQTAKQHRHHSRITLLLYWIITFVAWRHLPSLVAIILFIPTRFMILQQNNNECVQCKLHPKRRIPMQSTNRKLAHTVVVSESQVLVFKLWCFLMNAIWRHFDVTVSFINITNFCLRFYHQNEMIKEIKVYRSVLSIGTRLTQLAVKR